MRREQPSSHLAPWSCLPQSKPDRLPRQPQSPIFHSNKTGKINAWHWRCRVDNIKRICEIQFLRNSVKKRKIKLQALRFSAAAHIQWWDSFRSNKPRLPRKNKHNPAIKIVFISFQHQNPFKTSHKAQSSLFSTHCALLTHILVKYPWYFCNLANLIKRGGFLIKAKWKIAVPGLFRSLFNQRIAEWEKAITEWIESGICKEMSGRAQRYESRRLKPLICCCF